jgi:poly(3-hydroxybutyrate) depolymerase
LVSDRVEHWTFRYRADNGRARPAIAVVPAEYGPEHPSPPLPLVISPHGRGVPPGDNAKWWRDLPGDGGFAVVCPGGMGRRLQLRSWGWRGQIADLARMPGAVRQAFPWLRIDLRRIYAVGGSMGGQETLLLLGQHPQLLAGAVAFDSVTNFYLRYYEFAELRGGRAVQALARFEVGGTPKTNPLGYVLRSPNEWNRQIAASGVPLQLWWSTADKVVDQRRQSPAFHEALVRLHPRGPLEPVTGSWSHTSGTYSFLQLPGAVRWLGLDGEK